MMRKLPALLIFLAGFCFLQPTRAVADPVPEYTMKAAFLYYFALFTDWPEEIKGNFNLCILGHDSFDGALQTIVGKPVKGAPLAVLHIATAADAQQCHMLFFSDPVDANIRQVIDTLEHARVLTVTDADNLMEAGAMIGMKIENKRLVFEVNQSAAHRSHLSFRSTMMRLAHGVY